MSVRRRWEALGRLCGFCCSWGKDAGLEGVLVGWDEGMEWNGWVGNWWGMGICNVFTLGIRVCACGAWCLLGFCHCEIAGFRGGVGGWGAWVYIVRSFVGIPVWIF